MAETELFVERRIVHLVDLLVEENKFTVNRIRQLEIEPQENQERNQEVVEDQLASEDNALHRRA